MTAEQIVRTFFEEVRSGRNPDYASNVMAEQVLAHQVISEDEVTVTRTPSDYADHVREMIEAYGEFSLEILELLTQGDKVYVRWRQTGTHIDEVDGYSPTNLPVIEIASAVYRVENEQIAEYWIQIDRLGIERQLERNRG
ncbi:ester cyclase [Paenibacillus sp. OVF10]|nr:ester cyclase [Paenibacillus sp. OVF10]